MSKSSAFYTPLDFSVNNEFTEVSLLHESENGYSRVYKAERHGRLHVLKCLTDEVAKDPRYQQLLRKEFEISYQLSHPGIVRTMGIENVSGLGVCIVQEFIDGQTWDKFFGGNRVKDAERNRILIELCDALAYIHEHQIIHRDLKPQNIIITRNGHHPYIIDFGLADKDSYVVLKEPAGTISYASPEQQRPGILDNRSDIYSLGVIIDSVISVHDFRLKRISRKCMENNPGKRFVNALEISRMIKPVQWWGLWTTLSFLCAGAMIATAIIWGRPESQSAKVQNLQSKTSLQQKHIDSLQSRLHQMSSSLDSARQAYIRIESRQADNANYEALIIKAKKEVRDIAGKYFLQGWNAYDSMANDSLRVIYTLSEVYKIDYQPIISSVIRKVGLNDAPDPSAVRKILIDEWYQALYDLK